MLYVIPRCDTSIIKNDKCVCLHSQYDVIIYLFASSFCILYSVIKRNIYLNKKCASRIITPNEGKGKSIIMNFSCYIIKFYILQIFLYSISMNRKTEVFFHAFKYYSQHTNIVFCFKIKRSIRYQYK